MRKWEKSDGFTLIELLVVVAILGILAGIAVPRLTGVRKKAEKMALKSNAYIVRNTMEMYHAYFGEYPDIDEVSSLEELENELSNDGGFEINIKDNNSNIKLDEGGTTQSDSHTYIITFEDNNEKYQVIVTQEGIQEVTEQD